jgi:hypothetical protein
LPSNEVAAPSWNGPSQVEPGAAAACVGRPCDEFWALDGNRLCDGLPLVVTILAPRNFKVELGPHLHGYGHWESHFPARQQMIDWTALNDLWVSSGHKTLYILWEEAERHVMGVSHTSVLKNEEVVRRFGQPSTVVRS